MFEAFIQNGWVRNFLIPAAVFLLFFAVSVPFANFLFRLAAKASQKSGGTWGEKFSYGFRRPLHVILIVTGIYIALNVCPAVWGSASLASLIVKCFRSFLVLAVTWGFYRMADSVELNNTVFAKKLDLQVDESLLPVLSGVLRFLLVALAVLIVAQEWNFSISGLVAGLGLGGLAFALAAKDMLANLFGGLVILLDRPFSIGDWIKAGDVEGTVEEINFRSVKVRTIEQTVVTVPNSMVASAPVENYSRMGKRRVEFTLTMTYGTKPERIQSCAVRIRALLTGSSDVENDTFAVSLSGLGDSGPRLAVYYHTKTADYGEYLQVREKIFYSVLRILEEEKVEPAYPTSTVIVNKSKPV
jgi:MscS family membrane protein